MGKKIAVIDDEKNIVDILTFNLKKEGYEVLNAYDGEEGLSLIKRENPDLVLLDIMMPKKDGFEVCREVRKTMSVPIIMLTARAEEVDTVLGLELGADDYVTKPFGVRELMARVKANLRRHDADTVPEGGTGVVLRFNELEIYTERYEVLKREEKIELTPREYRLLTFLAAQKQKVFSREALLEKVWDFEFYGDVRTVDVTIRRLREKLEDDPGCPEYILTKRGVGYYFDCSNKE